MGSTTGSDAHSLHEPSVENFKFFQEHMKILVIGAGGLGCEVLKSLACMGFKKFDVIDMDTIDLSNLNRQFLFRETDIGKPKAVVAQQAIQERFPEIDVTAHYCAVQEIENPSQFYRNFDCIIAGLDSIQARRWMNSMVQSLVEFDEKGKPDPSTQIPLIDGGTEGFKGHCRIIIPGETGCIDCTLEFYPPQTTFPMCTIANTPRLPEHCIEWAKRVAWHEKFPDTSPDGDDEEHIAWLTLQAKKRAEQFNIKGVNYRLTKGVVKNIIPAVASTNAVIAALCVNECFKLVTYCLKSMKDSEDENNYMMLNQNEGVYGYTFNVERNENCLVCGRKTSIEEFSTNRDTFLEDMLESFKYKFL